MIYLYGFTDGAVPQAPGLSDAPVEAVPVGPVTALVSDLDEPPQADATALWRHEAVLEAVDADAAVLPARFGTVLADRDAVRALVTGNEPLLAAALDRVRGRVEVGVRIRATGAGPAPAPPDEPESGRDYLLRRRAEVHDLVDAAEALHAELSGVAVDAVRRRGDGRRLLLVGAYLVARADVDRLVERIRGLDVRASGLQLVSTGPWPPYHFAPTLQEVPGA